ncbi:hypothetical protein HYALB_00013301 [Hymenoscyphus albidus]|uniref:Uncharacterized protein n=1 Tax=Hymenoscyphus albidus TaxID=595503 RepID=A0A9N9LXU7_9HELO|nr:hypothetical protein HYALB_00013301 [Hymenoscyphus albidus]
MKSIWGMKPKPQASANADAAPGIRHRKVTATHLRVQKDITELSLPKYQKTTFENKDNLLNQSSHMLHKNSSVMTGSTTGAPLSKASDSYRLQAGIGGLQFLFLEPNDHWPFDKKATEDLSGSRESLKRTGGQSIRGGMVKSEPFDKNHIESWDGNGSQPIGTFVFKPSENASILQRRYSLRESAITAKSGRMSFWIGSHLQNDCVVLLKLDHKPGQNPRRSDRDKSKISAGLSQITGQESGTHHLANWAKPEENGMRGEEFE